MVSPARLPSQHSRGDDDIERAKSADDPAHGRMQQERPKTRVMAQEVVSIPQGRVLIRGQADPGYEEENHSHFE